MKFEIEKPKSTAVSFEEITKALEGESRTEIFNFAQRVSGSEYLYWDKIRHKKPIPEGISAENLWAFIKLIRESRAVKSPIKDEKNRDFTWSKLDYFEKFFHELDMNTGGELFAHGGEINNVNKQKLLTRGIMEEAIASSQLEGADTSRQAAKKMLREGRKPKNQSEQMIVNNYLSMKIIEEDYKNKEMSLDLMLELHSLITKDTLDSEGEKPRMREAGEKIYVRDKKTTELIYHEGPETRFVKTQITELIKFANDNDSKETFIHPVIKAIMLHFWMGFLHPFTDGNGRLARILFYWYLTRKGYWAFAYLPISKVIKETQNQYLMAYVYSEQDGNDLSYFIDYNLKKIQIAIEEFIKYIKRKSGENIRMRKESEEKYNLNLRQVYLLQFLKGDVDARTNFKSHMNVNQISRMTAAKDLKDLVQKGLIIPVKQGRNVWYQPTKKINRLFNS